MFLASIRWIRGNNVDHHQCSGWKPSCLECGACGQRCDADAWKPLRVNHIDRLEILNVRKEECHLNNIRRRASGCIQNRLDVRKHLMSLRLETFLEFTRFRVPSSLGCDENEITGADGL